MVNRIINRQPIPIQSEKEINQRSNQINQARVNSSFSDILRQQLGQPTKLTLSSHVEQRLSQRNINLTSADMERLESAVDKIAQKGARESLIMMDDVSYIVNIPKRTIITAVDGNNAKDNVFTNIDSAMIVK